MMGVEAGAASKGRGRHHMKLARVWRRPALLGSGAARRCTGLEPPGAAPPSGQGRRGYTTVVACGLGCRASESKTTRKPGAEDDSEAGSRRRLG